MMQSRGTSLHLRVPELDGVRGLAILLVVLYHYLLGVTNNHDLVSVSLRSAISAWWTGVDLFFVLSGFLIGGILIDHRNSRNYFKTFYMRRICRIFPIYFLWVGLFFLIVKLCAGHITSGWYKDNFTELWSVPSWSYFVFLQNFWMAKMNAFGPNWTAVTWSLCIEEHFYLIVPLLIWFVPARRLPAVLAGLLLFSPLFRLFLYMYYPQFLLWVILPGRADGLLLGVLCACLVRNPKLCDLVQRSRICLCFIFAILFLGMIYLTGLIVKFGWFTMITSLGMMVFGYSWVGLFYASFLLIVVTFRDGLFARLMRHSWLRHIGIISYCIYLIHMEVIKCVPLLIPSNAGATLVSLLVTYVLAVISWNFFEKPIITWGHSLSYSDSQPDHILSVQKTTAGGAE